MATKRDQRRKTIIANLISRLKDLRIRQKLSLTEVAARSGLSHTMVLRVEKGERLPTIDTLLRLADALGADLSKLLAEATRASKGHRS